MERQLNVSARLDFHNHLIPSVDDGAATLEDSLSGIGVMAAQSIDRIITTPHLRASLLGDSARADQYLGEVEVSWQLLSRRATDDYPAVQLWRGFEILLDVPKVDVARPELRLAGSKFVLVEFPFLSVPPNSARPLEHITAQGYAPIVAHPERYADVQARPAIVQEWLSVGANLQTNAGSVLGHYGGGAEKTAWMLLEQGVISYICSDYHSSGACDTAAAFAAVSERSNGAIADLLFSVNPGRIPTSGAPMPVEPVPARKSAGLGRFWRRAKS